jgi:hypothetical protein
MKTPYLDNLIKELEDGQNKGINSYYLNCQLRELKEIKKHLSLYGVGISLPDLEKKKLINDAFWLNLQNLSGREDFAEAFKKGVEVGVNDTLEHLNE